MFQGRVELSLDAKGRMLIPARYRDALTVSNTAVSNAAVLNTTSNGVELTLTKHPHGCLLVFPRAEWLIQREKIAAWPMSARAWQRIFLGSAVDVVLDGTGRMLIAPELRAAAGLQKDVVLMGLGSHFELWCAQALANDEAAALAQPMPDVLNELSF
jgi:MraZ protein